MTKKKTQTEIKKAKNPSPEFKFACDAVDLPHTRRQQRKWKQGRGLAFTRGRQLLQEQRADSPSE